MRRWIRWLIANWMNRYPDTCWCDLGMWAEFPESHPWSEIHEMRGTVGRCDEMGEHSYCGKCSQ